MRIRIGLFLLAMAGVLVMPTLCNAHPGHDHDGITDGLTHPLTGVDHLMAMIAVGLWAAQRGGKASIALPLAFVLAMIGGGVAALAGAEVPMVEQGILTSLFAIGLLIAFAVKLPDRAGVVIATISGFLHGAAHGGEASGSAWLFFVGAIASTIILHAAGWGVGVGASALGRPQLMRLGGAVTVVAGLMLAVGQP